MKKIYLIGVTLDDGGSWRTLHGYYTVRAEAQGVCDDYNSNAEDLVRYEVKESSPRGANRNTKRANSIDGYNRDDIGESPDY